MNNERNDENEICQNFDFYFHIRENTVFMLCACLIVIQGESFVPHTSIELVH